MDWDRKEAGRLDEMGSGRFSLRIEISPDGDIIAYIDLDGCPVQDEQGNQAKVEFCNSSGGGGTNPHTRAGLLAAYKGMILDNRTDPTGIPRYPNYLKEMMENANV